MNYTHKPYFDLALQSAADRLNSLAIRLRQQDFFDWHNHNLNIKALQRPDVDQIVSGLKKIQSPVIYFFQLENASLNPRIVNRIRDYKENGNSDTGGAAKRKCVRVHSDKDPNFETDILYVGSTGIGFHTRVKQHLGFGPKDTYALQLVHWAKGLDLKLDLYWMELAKDEIRYDIEDALAEQMMPLVGKRGTL